MLLFYPIKHIAENYAMIVSHEHVMRSHEVIELLASRNYTETFWAQMIIKKRKVI